MSSGVNLNSSLCNLCVLCVSVVVLLSRVLPQRHRAHRGCTEKAFAIAILLTGLLAQPVTAQSWPHPIPARVRDGANKDLMVMTLGDVSPSIADGVFDPSKDEMRLKDGAVLKNYYRDTLKIKYFAPIEKTKFPLPP